MVKVLFFTDQSCFIAMESAFYSTRSEMDSSSHAENTHSQFEYFHVKVFWDVIELLII